MNKEIKGAEGSEKSGQKRIIVEINKAGKKIKIGSMFVESLHEALTTQIQSIKEEVEGLYKDHCCTYGCDCGKQHLYCNYELDHGIELKTIIDEVLQILTKRI